MGTTPANTRIDEQCRRVWLSYQSLCYVIIICPWPSCVHLRSLFFIPYCLLPIEKTCAHQVHILPRKSLRGVSDCAEMSRPLPWQWFSMRKGNPGKGIIISFQIAHGRDAYCRYNHVRLPQTVRGHTLCLRIVSS